MKITRNTTVKQLTEALNTNFKAVQTTDKSLAESIAYAAKRMKEDAKSVKKSDLVDLVKQTATLLGTAFVEPGTQPQLAVAENSVKPTGSKLKPAGDKKSEKASEKKPEESKAEPDKKSQTTEQKKTSAEKTPDKGSKNSPKVDVVDKTMFPAQLTAGDTAYEIAHDIKDIGNLLEAFNAEEDIVFAFYWNKKQIRQFNYSNGTLPAPTSGFENDLDLATALYVSDDKKVCYALSMYTEALYQVMPQSFEEIEGIRYSDGIEFQIYKAVK